MKPTPPQQRSLFDSPALSLAALPRAVKCALRSAVEASGLSRDEVVFRSNALAKEAGLSICAGNGALSLSTLNKWLDLNSPHMPGFMAMKVLCEVLQDVEVYVLVLEPHGLGIMKPEDKKFCKLGRATHQLKQARRELKKAEEQL